MAAVHAAGRQKAHVVSVKPVIARSFEGIHRSNLLMGVLLAVQGLDKVKSLASLAMRFFVLRVIDVSPNKILTW